MGLFDFLLKTKKQPVKKNSRKIIKDGVEFEYVKIKNSKSIKIIIKDRFKIKITLPFNCCYKVAEDFVFKKSDWIKKELKAAEKNLINGDFKTKTNNFIISSGLINEPVIKKSGNLIQFIYPLGADFYSKEIQTKAHIALKRALYSEAKEYLPKRIGELARLYGFKYNKISLKTCKTRWGSCSYTNNINLNINLMNLPDEYIDYVLIHELCHTVEKNHGERFWRLVENCMPNAKAIQKKLKKQKCIV